MRTFDTMVVDTGGPRPIRYNRPGPAPLPVYRGFEQIFVTVSDGDGWKVFVQVDNLIDAKLIATALNAKDMRGEVQDAKEARELQLNPPPPGMEERLAALEERLEQANF